MRFSRRVVKFAIWITAVLAVFFGAYLFAVYRQLEEVFAQRDQFVPTRIYSDVVRIAPPQTRAYVDARLHALAYVPASSPDGSQLIFSLHAVDYPTFLVPDGPFQNAIGAGDARGQAVMLRFSGTGPAARLASVLIAGKEVPEFYLEPELVATLSRGGGGESVRAIRQNLKLFDDDPDQRIPPLLWKAIIAAEDQHFLDHHGLDPRGLLRALWVNLRTQSLAQGGSTITQQLVKNLMVRRTKNIFRKVNELFLALMLEARSSKPQILERYLNEVYLGQVGSLEVHGVAEGAQHFFGKRHLRDLNLGEIALMAGLIRGPGYYSPYRYRDRAIERQRYVLRKMVETGQIAQAEADAALALPIRLAPPQTSANKAPYFTDFVKAELIRHLRDKMSEQELATAGFRVYTTLDTSLNSEAQRAVGSGITALEKQFKLSGAGGLEGALAAVDQSTGFIRTLVGGRSYALSNFNRILNMKRQVGSTFKPVVYLAALDKGADDQGISYGPARPVEDAPWKLIYDHGRQSWTPNNYEKDYLGWITMRSALAKSINTVSARLAVELGLDRIVETARAIGIESDLPRVPSLALGVAELSPVELLRAYATIANRGVQDELTVIRCITQNDGSDYARFVYHPKQVFPAGPAELLTDMMRSVFTEGTARDAARLGFKQEAAGKTGTTSDHRDSWFAGFTPRLTAVVWVGFDQAGEAAAGKSRIKLTGAGSALPIWVNFMNQAADGAPSDALSTGFAPSPNLVRVHIDRHTGKMAYSGCPDAIDDNYLSSQNLGTPGCETLWPPSVTESRSD